MNKSLPLFYFKPTICWIDDDTIFLDAVNISFQQDYNCLTFNDPHKANVHFQTYEPPTSTLSLKRELVESDMFGTNNHYPVDINISGIRGLSEISNKLHEIAVIIIDHNMPEMNGLELCKQLQQLPCKKILLTGDASSERAIEAFNQGLIDKFIRKDLDIASKLRACIDELIYEYFRSRTSGILSHIESSRPSILSDISFVRLFNSWRIQNSIKEFYLMNRNGSFIAKDQDDKLFYLVAMSENDIKEFVEFNAELFEGESNLLDDVNKGRLIPFFGVNKEPWEIDRFEWRKYFYPAKTISGRQTYYWAIINR